jgi:hypothetical protein
MITDPFGNSRSSAATVTAPSGSTRINGAGATGAPVIRSNPKQPT